MLIQEIQFIGIMPPQTEQCKRLADLEEKERNRQIKDQKNKEKRAEKARE